MTNALSCENLVKRYSSRETNAVDGISFTVAPGEAVGVLGPNGAGKTTLIKMICGVAPPTAGRIAVFGAPPTQARARRDVSVIHQSTPFDMMLSVHDNLRIAASFRGFRWREVRDHVDRLLTTFELADHVDHLVFTLSGGQHRRLQVIRALIRVPSLLVLDEPSSGMDVVGRRYVWQLLAELRAEHGTATIWTSHHIEEMERNCGRVIVLDRGRLLQSGSPQELIDQFGKHVLRVSPFRADQSEAIIAVASRFGFAGQRDAGAVCLSGADPGAVLPGLLAALRDERLAVSEVKLERASLEDVFVTLTSRDVTAGLGRSSV